MSHSDKRYFFERYSFIKDPFQPDLHSKEIELNLMSSYSPFVRNEILGFHMCSKPYFKQPI